MTRKKATFWYWWSVGFSVWAASWMIYGVVVGSWWSAVLQAICLTIFIGCAVVWHKRLELIKITEGIHGVGYKR